LCDITVLCLLLVYRGLNQIGIRIESPEILVIVMCILCVLTFYDFIVKFKIWLRYTEERDRMKKEFKEFENQNNDSTIEQIEGKNS